MAKKRKISSLYIFPLLFIIIVSSYALRYVFFNIDTEIIKYGTMQNSFETKGLIVRNEWIYNFPSDLQLKNKVEEGQRVPFGKKIVEIVKGDDIQDDLSSRINKLEERINEISKNKKENEVFEKDTIKLENNINEKVESVKKFSDEGDLESLANIKGELSADLYKKSLISGSNSFSGRNLEQLKNEKIQLENLYKNNLDVVYAKSAGVVSYQLDGLEQSLNPSNIEKFNIEDIKKIIANSNEEKIKNTVHDGVKVVENYTWYVCTVLNQNQAKDLKEGSNVKLIFKGYENQFVNAKLKCLSKGQEDEYLATFETNECFKDYYRIRVADISIITHQYEGFVVSKSSIVENDKEKGIYVIKRGIVRFIPAEVLAFEDNKALIKNIDKKEEDNQTGGNIIKVYDEVVKNTKRIKANQRVI